MNDIPQEVRDARNEAIRRVEANTDPVWAEEATAAGILLAEAEYIATPDDLWDLVDSPPEPRSLGPIMIRLANMGIFRKTDIHECSRRGHAPPIRVYISMMHGECEHCNNYGLEGEWDGDGFCATFCKCGLGQDSRYRKVIEKLVTEDLGLPKV